MRPIVKGSFCFFKNCTVEGESKYCNVTEAVSDPFKVIVLGMKQIHLADQSELELYPIQVGDTCVMAHDYNWLRNGDEVVIKKLYWSIELIAEIFKVGESKIHTCYTRRLLPKITTASNVSTVKQCTCDNFSLFNSGCKCGYIEFERSLVKG